MALKDTNTNEEYPYVFLVSQRIQQRIPDSAAAPAEYFLSVLLKFYKIVDDKMVFNSAQLTIDVDDFTAMAGIAAAGGDMTYYDTLMSQQDAVKKMVEGETGRTFEVI